MPEIWIKPNRRALALGLIFPAVLFIVASAMCFVGLQGGQWPWYVAAALFLIVGGVAAGTLLHMLRQPRVAYEQGELLLYLDATRPTRVPVDVVECFFVGQAEGLIHDAAGKEAEVSTVIVRLAESAKDWHHRDVKPALGHWCEGYITIRGTWCEPIGPDLLKKLNRRLVEVHREQKAQLGTPA